MLALNITNSKVINSQRSSLKVYAVLDAMEWTEGDAATSGTHLGLRLTENRVLVGSYES